MSNSPPFCLAGLSVLLALAAGPAIADGGVIFIDIAAGGANGLVYSHATSPRQALFDAIVQQPTITTSDLPNLPMKPAGAPGVALLDYDLDGDLDIYVTNTAGTANSLFSNQLVPGGTLTFVDVAAAAGVAATAQDSQGVCFGDIDNDGDPDLLVLGGGGANLLFENQGDGTFDDITIASQTGGGARTSTSCSMGDVDGDGLLDIAVANAYDDWTHLSPYFGEPFVHNQHNQLFLNTGGSVFSDVSAAAGIETHDGLTPGTALLSWAMALVDYDLDGDLDFLVGDDQTVLLPAIAGGQDVGFIRTFENDGTGVFTDNTSSSGMDRFGAWMGLAFGDLNCDGNLDVFGANAGDYMISGPPFNPGDWASRWFLGQGGGTFTDPGVGGLVVTPFGWGASIADYDNDADADIIYHGGFLVVSSLASVVFADNPGVILQNQSCGANFSYDGMALASSTDHARRNVQGMAVGDLDDDGFVDIVSVSNLDQLPATVLSACGIVYGSVFDPLCFLAFVLLPSGPGEFDWTGIQFADGTLAVEINSGGNGNGSVAVDLLGTVGITTDGGVNRDGIGAVVSLDTFPQGLTAMQPVVAGSSYASQDSLRLHFGLGTRSSGRIEV
ncbi:MAG: CRTAC1 family protein, partial [Thermoanaerobaculia bacterium]